MDIYEEDNEYYEDEVEDTTNLEGDEEEEGNVWDDSALIAAWDIAVKEYQTFHSIKANKTDTKSDTISNTIPTSSNNKEIETEKPVNIIEGFVQDIASALDDNEDASTSGPNISEKEQKQNVQKPHEQKVKETKQIKPQMTTESSLNSKKNSQATRSTTATYPSYSHNFPGYYSYPPPLATSTANIPPQSFNEQVKENFDTQEDQEESQLPPTDETTTSYSNANAYDSYYNGEYYSPYAYGWHSNHYPPPPRPEFYPPHSSFPPNPNVPFFEQKPKPPNMTPQIPGFDDEAFTNLIMAWYYSGYYTGLYHGRKGR